MYNPDKMSRLSIRFSQNQMQVIEELKNAMGVSASFLIRTIVLDFITRNEKTLQHIVDYPDKFKNRLKEIDNNWIKK